MPSFLATLTPVPLRTVLDDPGLGIRQVAGPGDDRLVGMVHTSEWEDPSQYLLGGELLLTAGRHLAATGEQIDAYVRRLVAADAAALGFGLAPVYDEVPSELVEACDRHRLPLLEVPPRTPFVAVSRVVHLAMAEARSREVQRMSQAQTALASAAARPDAVESVMRQLASHLDAWTVLIDGDGRELFSAGACPPEPLPARLHEVAALQRAHHPGARPPGAAVDHHGPTQLIVQTVPGADSTGSLQLGLVTHEQPTALDRAVTGVGVVLLSLLTGPRHALAGDVGTASALVQLLLGADPAEVADGLHPDAATSHDVAPVWRVVAGRLSKAAGPQPASPVHVSALGTALNTPYVEVRGSSLRALVPVPADVSRGQGRDRGGFEAALRLGWTLGVSAPAAGRDLPTAAERGERALRRALATGTPLALVGEAGESLQSLVDPDDAAAMAHARFAPLQQAGPPGASALLDTLRTWLSLHGSWDRTALAIDIHRNTVRQRIHRIATLLDTDLDDADARMELWFALRYLD